MQQVELNTQSEGSAAGGRCVLKLWIADRELFQITGNPPVKAYVESIAFRSSVLHRVGELGFHVGPLAWEHPKLTPVVDSDRLLFNEWQRGAEDKGVEARIVIPASADGRSELQLQAMHEEAVETADEALQALPPPTELPAENAQLQAIQTQLAQVVGVTATLKQEVKILRHENSVLQTQIERLQGENSTQNTKLERLPGENTAQNKKIKTQNKKIETQNNNIATLNKKIKTQNTTINRLEGANSKLGNKILNQDEKIEEQNKKIKMQGKQIKTQNKKIETLHSLNGDLRTQNVKQDVKIKTLESENGDLRTRNAEQDREIEAQGQTLSRLENQARRGRQVVLRGMLERYRERQLEELTEVVYEEDR